MRQFRLPAFFCDAAFESLMEVCAGKLEGERAESRISKEAEEETGFFVRNRRRIVEASMNPGSSAEKLTFFAARAADSKTKAKILKSSSRRSMKRWP